MKDQQQDVWVGLEDKTNDPSLIEQANQEFYELPVVDALADEKFVQEGKTNRRDFLKYLGFGIGAATIAASCEIPVKRAVPYVVKPDSIVPGVASYYASTFVNGGDFCSVLVKTREGRPIKIEGNPSCDITQGGTNARTQASVLSLYNNERFQGPLTLEGEGERKGKLSWEDLDKQVLSKLSGSSRVRIITNTVLSPTTKKIFAEFTAKYPNTKVVSYDPVSYAGMLIANEECFGQKVLPSYKFDQAEVVVTFGADFLGTWISPIEFAADWVKNRTIKDTNKPKMSRLVAVESGMSMTGSNADNRILVKPSEQGAAVVTLYNAVASRLGGGSIASKNVNAPAKAALTQLADELVKAQGKSLVVCGSNDKNVQVVVNALNNMLGNYGATIDMSKPSLQRQGDERDMQAAIRDMKGGAVDVAIVYGANPAYDLPNADEFKTAFAKVGTRISFAQTIDETTALCGFVAPDHHYLESWGDAEPKKGHINLIQPTIRPLFDTRQAGESLLVWAQSADLDRKADQPFMDYMKKSWEATVFQGQSGFATFQGFWDNCLHDGVFHTTASGEGGAAFAGDAAAAAGNISNGGSGLEVNFFETVAMGAGQYADNPWLMEMPDPVMRTVWGNYLQTPIGYDAGKNAYSAFMGMETSSKGYTENAKITVGGKDAVLPVVNQFGQMPDTVSAGLGYGRTQVTSAGQNTGINLFSMCSYNKDGLIQYHASVTVEKAGREQEFACVQYHNTMGVTDKEGTNVDEKILAPILVKNPLTKRSIIRTSNVDDLKDTIHDLEHERHHHQKLNSYTLYPGHDKEFKKGHHWAMHIDLNACIGCGACTVSCMAENNVPVVGKKEVHRHHEMTWLRIDRYYYGDVNNPSTVYQPMMCQHCDNAPCENVCPVAATNHSSEGLNQMTYNRCIGTRYCANNCPYKVRRFNWYDYTTADLWPANEYSINGEDLPFGADNLTRMVLNPDVTVRSRGVIEKCSFCVQRIQEGKLLAKREQRSLRDADVKTACQTACPTGAIVFGDQNNDEGVVAQKLKSKLNYLVLEEVNTAPSVNYTMKVNNRSDKMES